MSKRTREEADAVADAGEVVSKKLKKDKKEKKEKKSKSTEDVAVASATPVEVEEKSGLSKEERKALKRAKKEAAKAAEAQEVTEPATETKDDDEAAAKAARKAARKAEKAAAKLATKTPESNGDAEQAEAGAKINGVGKSEAEKYYAEKKIAIEDAKKQDVGPILSFDSLPFDAASKKAFFGSFKEPSPIQAATWPYLFNGRDVIGVAETGSGKTYGFGVPCINRLTKEKKVQVCIVSPTRELALQIQEQMVKLTTPRGLKATCVYGGTNKDEQRQQLRGAQIIVATPGRLVDFMNDGTIDLSGVTYMVLDEADRMLDKGFEQDIRNILSGTASSETRQTVMFTATWPDEVRKLANEFLRDPVRIMIGENASGELRANIRIKQDIEVLGEREKQDRMLAILKQYQSGKNKNDRILVFCLYKKEATRVEETIRRRGFRVAGIHGDLNQAKREESLAAFKKGDVPILVATDVAARGLDIPAVKLVLNVTFPLTVEDYVHRIGR